MAVERTEVRFSVPNDVLTIVDALSLAHTLDRGQMLNVIVREWAGKRMHEARMVHKLARFKPDTTADSGEDSGFRDSQRGDLS